jgi:hypothetical protein
MRYIAVILVLRLGLSVVYSIVNSKYNYLRIGKKDDAVYINNILRKSVDSTKKFLNDNSNALMELEFLPLRKNDISVIETLDTTREFVAQYTRGFLDLEPWVVFPEKKEAVLALQNCKFDDKCFVTYIDDALKKAKDPSISKPGLVILTSPGFNVDEWIDAVDLPLPMVIVNGDLDRLRNGYYPSLFYPKLAKVTKSFYKNVQQVYYLSAVAAAGDRFKGYIVREYPEDFVLLRKLDDTGDYKEIDNYGSILPKGIDIWKRVNTKNVS